MAVVIQTFLDERKAAWLKDRLKKAENETAIVELQQQADERFHLTSWLPDAAKRVAQLAMVSHPGKFSHPSAKTSNIIAAQKQRNDGYLRSGNVNYALDVFGNAAAMDVYKFLSLNLSTGQTILEGFEQNNEALIQLLQQHKLDFEVLRKNFLRIKQGDESSKTDHLVKQVYFPVAKGQYHVLSILTASGLITRLKKTVDELRFSDETKLAKEKRKKNEHDAQGYADLLNLTITAYGGTQPQNISVLNSQNAGRAYLLSSCPPTLQKRQIRLPKTDFFKQCVYAKNYQDSFLQLHKLMLSDINNQNIRNAIRNIVEFIVDQVLFYAVSIRQSYEAGWSTQAYYQGLDKNQKIWLDQQYLQEKDFDNHWRDEIILNIARWVERSYSTVIADAAVLGKSELEAFKETVQQALQKTKGVL